MPRKVRRRKMTPQERGALGGRTRAENLTRAERVALATKAAPFGGRARAEALTAAERTAIAIKGAQARWAKKAS